MSFEELENANQIFGGFATDDESKSLDGSSSGCWCTCHCMERSITGFQLGMMGTHSTGQNPSPRCSTPFSQIWGI